MNVGKSTAVLAATIASVLMCFSSARAETHYPKKTVTLITHSSPGSGTDVYLRQMIKYLNPILGANCVVENVKGGAGAKAIAKLATSPADGSIFYGSTQTYIDTSLLSKPRYTYKDVEPVVNIFFDAEVAYVRADSPYKSLAAIVKNAKAHPNTQKWGSGTAGSLDRQALEELKDIEHVKAAIIPHDGGGDTLIDVLNGTLDFALGQVPALRGQLEAGKIRLVAALTDEPLPDFPKVTTAKSQGINLVAVKFRGIVGPKGLPENVIKAWETAIPKVLADPGFKKWYSDSELIPAYMPHKQDVKFVDQVVKKQQAFFAKYNISSAK